MVLNMQACAARTSSSSCGEEQDNGLRVSGIIRKGLGAALTWVEWVGGEEGRAPTEPPYHWSESQVRFT